MALEKEELKLRLIESQMQVLQYQHKEVSAGIAAFKAQEVAENEAIFRKE